MPSLAPGPAGAGGPATRFRAELVDPRSLPSGLREEWRQLAELRENPFLTPEWYEAWLASHHQEEPFLIVCFRGQEARGVLPLVRSATGPLKVLRFAGARRGDWFTPACRFEDEEEMAAACRVLLSQRRRAWSLIKLDRMDCEGCWPQALWAANAGNALGTNPPSRSDALPYIRFDEGGYESYLAGRSRNFRSQLGSRRRKLERDHRLVFRLVREDGELRRAMDEFFRLHEERWSRRGGSSALTADTKELHHRFAAMALEQRWLRLWIAEVDGEAAAAWYGWRVGDRYCYSLSGLGERYEHLGLGTLLLAHTIEQAAAEGATTYDLMWGDEPYKKRFETGRRTTRTWVFGRRRHAAHVAARLLAHAGTRARRLPPRARAPLKRARQALGD